MKLVIEIPDGYDLTMIQNGSIASKQILNAVKNGTPLPKGHGRLIDADALEYDITSLESDSDVQFECIDKQDIADAPTIIEADNAESEVSDETCD